ncbi:uncharacterized protein LOC127878487 [Dreissena polymorpha]|uniref:uncharacterized protein LOC127878487 n=1 Tax=Dreissena polymorpha TaxID=45954 RepID=UPI0022643EFD|nr:uncharacterized protein LOC127878487 [Dreissena polymorpha]
MNIAQLPVDFVIYVIQVSQLVMAVDGGCVNKWKGKQLADISVEELPDIEENVSDDDAVEERGPVPIESESIESDEGVDAMDIKITESDEGRYPIVSETSEAVICNSETETLLGNQTRPSTYSVSGTPGRKVPWSRSIEEFLRKAFKSLQKLPHQICDKCP